MNNIRPNIVPHRRPNVPFRPVYNGQTTVFQVILHHERDVLSHNNCLS